MMFLDPTWRVNPIAPSARAVVVTPNSAGDRSCVVSFLGRQTSAQSAGGRTLSAGDSVSFVEAADGLPWVIQIGTESGADYPTRFSRRLEEWADKAPASLFQRYVMRDNPKIRNYSAVKIIGFDESLGIASFPGGSAPVKFGTEQAVVSPGDIELLYDSGSDRHVIGRGGAEAGTKSQVEIKIAYMPRVAVYDWSSFYWVVGVCSTYKQFRDSIISSIYDQNSGTISKRRILTESELSYIMLSWPNNHAYMGSTLVVELTVLNSASPSFFWDGKYEAALTDGWIHQPDSALEIVR